MHARNRVVAHTIDGKTFKGYTLDFTPNKPTFHIVSPDDDKNVAEIAVSDLKAIFYVKSFEGDPERPTPGDLAQRLASTPGLKLKITFRDGEVLYGTAMAYSPGRQGFFVTPVDADGNNERVYVLADSIESVDHWR